MTVRRFALIVRVFVGVLVVGLACLFVSATSVARESGGAIARGSLAHTRPVALAVDARGDLLYVALSTDDSLAVVDVGNVDGKPQFLRRERLPGCGFPTALAALPRGGVVVSCRFSPRLFVVERATETTSDAKTETKVETKTKVEPLAAHPLSIRFVDAGPEHGHRGVAVDGAGRFAYVASAARGGIKVVDLGAGRVPSDTRPDGVQAAPFFLSTGIGPHTVRLIANSSDSTATTSPLSWLMVANRIAHTVTIHAIDRVGEHAGRPGPALQTITTEAPVLDFQVTEDALLLLTYEDRALSRAHRDVEGLDSVILVLPRVPGPTLAFSDPGIGKRTTVHLSERAGEAIVALEAVAVRASASPVARESASPARDRRVIAIAVAGAGSDNVWWLSAASTGNFQIAADQGVARSVGANPGAVTFLPDGRLVTADRLSDTLTFLDSPKATTQDGASSADRHFVSVGNPQRTTPADWGERLFFSRALVPNNVATGALSLYTCASCHVDGHIDGRRHPSKFNRFFSMTKTCRGLKGTAPFLSLGVPATLSGFADNIVGTHAQGALQFPDTFDRYDVTLDAPTQADPNRAWSRVRLNPAQLRASLTAYMDAIPNEPSPFVEPGRARLTDDERRGLALFRANCAGCHRLASDTYARGTLAEGPGLERALLQGRVALTATGLFDVGTPVLGAGGNNPPSLRGIWAAAPYFSDGSAASLEDVVLRTNPQATKVHAPENARASAPPFSPAERAALMSFLRAL